MPDSSGSKAHSMRIHLLSIRLLIRSFHMFCGDMFQGVVVLDASGSRVNSIRILSEFIHILSEYGLSPSICFVVTCSKDCGARFKWQLGPFSENSSSFYKTTYSFLPFVLW